MKDRKELTKLNKENGNNTNYSSITQNNDSVNQALNEESLKEFLQDRPHLEWFIDLHSLYPNGFGAVGRITMLNKILNLQEVKKIV